MGKDLVKREEPIIKLKRVKEPETSVEERNVAHETRMERAKLEAAELKAKRTEAELRAKKAQRELDYLTSAMSGEKLS